MARDFDYTFLRTICAERAMLKSLRRKKLLSTPLPSAWRRIIDTDCPFYNRLPVADQKELDGQIQVFMAEKGFEGCGGLVMTDEIRISIAGFACLLLLHRETDYYPGLRSILVYPGTYVAPTIRHIGSGVMVEKQESRAGESWSEGAVVLAWDAVRSSVENPGSGFNVVWHEFAHQLDFENGQLADGVPLLNHREPRTGQQRRDADWVRVMRAEHQRLQAQVERGDNTILRDYGASDPVEFFAVATECFFSKPQEMQEHHPELYGEMKWFYRQDPLGWQWPRIRIQ